MRIEQVMRKDVRTCTDEDALSEPVRIMRERDCGCVPVLNRDGSGRVVGIVTDRDICIALHSRDGLAREIQVKSVMSAPPETCKPDETIQKALELMCRTQVRRLPVVDDAGHLLGLISLADLAETTAGAHASNEDALSKSEIADALAAICRPRSAVAVVPR